MGTTILMGRKRWETIGAPLAGRRNNVATRDAALTPRGCLAISDAEASSRQRRRTSGCLGADMFEQLLPRAAGLICATSRATTLATSTSPTSLVFGCEASR